MEWSDEAIVLSVRPYGESNAIRLVPMGWNPAAGESYTVTVAGVSTPISYTIDFVDCP